ncbi:MAG: Holliday junction branch migration protein RuvA [Planctomycetes bacterium]|nr:Holliday junction branch migration protein RuvA [Planctomycetota bacterium]MCP4771598.1 Holliday junction branch migration protein RuvA [Planctomycetota bacterium]MCP4860102.1 Holliday junction branch migration protein RuvA [Planctomycetota bacterium]
MYEYLQGRIDEVGAAWVIVDVGGVGWHLSVSGRCAAAMEIGSEQRLLVHLAVSETSQVLYGFENGTERALFRRLLQVNGIGPSSAIGLLSSLPPDEMVRAILDGDTKRLTAMKGVGKKTAERLIVELRDHLEDLVQPGGAGSLFTPPTKATASTSDLERVLVELGASPALAETSARAAYEKLGASADFQELLRFALASTS